MNNGTKALGLALILGLAFALAGCSEKEEPKEVQDINAVRAELRGQVDRGELTKEEAIVKLAEAQVKYGSRKKEQGNELSPELEAFGKELKGQIASGKLTEEEAKAAWMEAIGKAKVEKKGSKDSPKETK